jgi:hypothetical protein
MFTFEHQKVSETLRCEKCDYTCRRKSDYNKHLATRKHKNVDQCLLNVDPKVSKVSKVSEGKLIDISIKKLSCICGKEYVHKQSLSLHRKTCELYKISNEYKSLDNNINLSQLVMEVVKSNSELQKQNHDFQMQMIDFVKNSNNQVNTVTNNTSNIHNSNNKTFNLQVFLNETCKDAMNIMDFVDSLQIQLSDLENVGRNGFVAGISDIILKNLRALDITQRPIHCSDQKREIVYVKDDNQWHKEHPDNEKLKKAIKYIAHKNTCLIKEWKAKYPDCGQAASRKSDLYNKIVY